MSRRTSLHIDPGAQQHQSTPPSSPNIHRIVIESRHYDSTNSSATALNPQTEPSSPRDSQYFNDQRLSIAAMALIDELDMSSTLSRRSSVSHHIIIETLNDPPHLSQQQQQHIQPSSSTIASGSNRSSLIGGVLGGPYFFNENSTTTLYNPRADHGRYSSGYHYNNANNRSSIPPGGPLAEEEEYDIGTITGSSSARQSHIEKYNPTELEGVQNFATSNYSDNIIRRESSHVTAITGDGESNNGSSGSPNSNKSPRSSIVTSTEKSREKWPVLRKRILTTKKTAKSLFIKYWFLLGLGFVIGMAWLFPDIGKTNGTIQAQYTVKWGAVIVIFLLSGLGIDIRVMLKTFLQWRLHLVIQMINFMVMPFLMYGIVLMFIKANARIDVAVYKGWMIAMTTSTTVSSNVVMTRNAKGNDSGALFNAAFGNLLGIFVCPALLTVFQQDSRIFPPGTPHGNPNYITILRTLGFTVLLPLLVGQIIRFVFSESVKKLAARLRFPIINNLALLILVWSVFCDGVASNAFNQMTAVDIVSIVFVDIFMYVFACILCIYVARVPWPMFLSRPKGLDRWQFSKQDTVAIMYCGSTKTVSMGIPLINVLYAESSYGVVGVLSLPLLLYHIIQLFIGNFQVQMLKNWINKDNKHSKRKASIPEKCQQEKHQVGGAIEEPEVIHTISTSEPSSTFDNIYHQQENSYYIDVNIEQRSHNRFQYPISATGTIRRDRSLSVPMAAVDNVQGVFIQEQPQRLEKPDENLGEDNISPHQSHNGSSTEVKTDVIDDTSKNNQLVGARAWDISEQVSYESPPAWQTAHQMSHDIAPVIPTTTVQRVPSFESALSQLSFASFDNEQEHDVATVINQSNTNINTSAQSNNHSQSDSTITETK